MRPRDLGAAAVLLAFALFAITQARGLRFGTVVAPGPGFFPLCLAAALGLVSIALLVSGWRASTAAAASASEGPAAPAGSHFAMIGTLAALFVYALVLERVGFLLATFGLLLFFSKALQRRTWLVALGGAAATAVVSHVVFKIWLGVNLPSGVLTF